MNCGTETITAPFDGEIRSVFIHPAEHANRGEPIVALVAMEPHVWVEAYFDTDDFDVLQPGSQAVVELPDGSESEGIVRTSESTAYGAEQRNLDTYRPEETDHRADVFPATKADAAQWRAFDRTEVKVRSKR